jgi:hypothetical protein
MSLESVIIQITLIGSQHDVSKGLRWIAYLGCNISGLYRREWKCLLSAKLERGLCQGGDFEPPPG